MPNQSINQIKFISIRKQIIKSTHVKKETKWNADGLDLLNIRMLGETLCDDRSWWNKAEESSEEEFVELCQGYKKSGPIDEQSRNKTEKENQGAKANPCSEN